MSEYLENQGQRSQEGDLVSVPEAAVDKKHVCWLSTLAGISLFLFVPAIIMMILFEKSEETSYVYLIIFGCLLVCSTIGAPLIAIVAKIQIALSDDRLGGGGLANFVLIAVCIILSLTIPRAMSGAESEFIQRARCNIKLKKLAKAMRSYAEQNGDRLPDGSGWCDLLIADTDVQPEDFLCRDSGAVYGESSYALNSNATGKKLSDLPGDMVLLFETNEGRTSQKRMDSLKEREFVKSIHEKLPVEPEKHKIFKARWNQVGGPEIFARNHKREANVAYADGQMHSVRFNYPAMQGLGLESLVWDESKKQYPASDYPEVSRPFVGYISPVPVSVYILGGVVFAAGLVVLYVTRVWNYRLLSFVTAAGACLIGYLCGGLSVIFYRPEYPAIYELAGGAVLGLWLSLCYTGILMRLQVRLHGSSINQLAISLGIATGIICSSLLHLVLLLIYESDNGFGMVAGLPFGIVGGAILGSVSGRIARKYYVRPQKIEQVEQKLDSGSSPE